MYACDNGLLKVPKRPAGAINIHDNKTVHGVTLLKSGIRYQLFLLKYLLWFVFDNMSLKSIN